MSRDLVRRMMAGIVAAAFVVFAAAATVCGQEPSKPDKSTKEKPAAEKPVDKPKPAVDQAKKPRGSLPSFYSKVVTPEQREKIYAIQAKNQAELDRLKAEIQALIARQDAEIEAVLTPEQRSQVEKWRSASADRRKEKLATEKPDEVIKKAQEEDAK